jgi:hypothetical protein
MSPTDPRAEKPSIAQRLWAWLGDRFGLAAPIVQALRGAEQQALRAKTRLREAIDVLPEGLRGCRSSYSAPT